MKPKEGTGNIYMCVFFRFGRSSRWMVNQSNRERNEILLIYVLTTGGNRVKRGWVWMLELRNEPSKMLAP